MRILFTALALFLPLTAFALEIKTDGFESGAAINSKYTCDAQNVSPLLAWQGAPAGTRSYALVCEDPDAPGKIWSHWVVFNIPASANSLQENFPKLGTLVDGTVQGVNDFGFTGYSGPCPPPNGPHRYYFKLYAFDSKLLLDAGCSRSALLEAMQGHILAGAELFGTYDR